MALTTLKKTQTTPHKVNRTKSSGNLFADLGFPPEEALILQMRSRLMNHLEKRIAAQGWTQVEAAQRLGIGQSRVSDLTRGKWDKFSLDMLVKLVARADAKARIELAIA
jgi:predicted XRE-type DNA-binding protein